MDMPTVEITRPDLPNPLPTNHGTLMACFYDHWQALTAKVRENNAALHPGACDVFYASDVPGMMRSPRQDEIAAVMPAKVNAAVVLGNFNYQIGNGGFSQWDGNGYSASIDSLVQLLTGAVALDLPQAEDVLDLVETFARRKADGHDEDDGEEGYSDPYDDLDTRYYALGTEALYQSMLDQFEDILAASFRPVMKRAA